MGICATNAHLTFIDVAILYGYCAYLIDNAKCQIFLYFLIKRKIFIRHGVFPEKGKETQNALYVCIDYFI